MRYSILMKSLKVMLYVMAAVWIVFSMGSALREPNLLNEINIYSVYGALMAVNAVIAAGMAAWWSPKQAVIRWLGYTWISLNILLSVTDQVGVIDILILLFSAVILWMMAKEARKIE